MWRLLGCLCCSVEFAFVQSVGSQNAILVFWFSKLIFVIKTAVKNSIYMIYSV